MAGRLIVVSGSSGSGKSTLIRRALESPGLVAELSVSATTRPPRPGEVDGLSYHFWEQSRFLAERERGGFLEWAEFAGNLYGTPLDPVRERLARGRCVILEIEVQGALQVREKVPDAFLIWIGVPGFDALEARLRSRKTESEESIARRLAVSRWEHEQAPRYDIQILNDDLDRAVPELVSLLRRSGCGG